MHTPKAGRAQTAPLAQATGTSEATCTLRAKGSVLSGRATVELNVYGWEIEAGVSGDLLSIGAEAATGYFPDDGFSFKRHVSPGWYGIGYIFRVKPKQ